MLRLVTDEQIHGGIVRGIHDRYPEIDIVRVQEVGLSGKTDAEILAWALANATRALASTPADRQRGFLSLSDA